MECTRYLANTRMYDVCPAVAGLWLRLVDNVARRSGVPLVHEPHAWPADIEVLWRNPLLGMGFICGRPFRLFGARHRPLAVPVLEEAPQSSSENLPAGSLYATSLLVRDDAPWNTLEESFGSRLGWTVAHSHSGYNALRRTLLPYYRGTPLYREFVGPLHTPGRCLDALRHNEIDVAPLDGYCHTLLRRHAPEKLAGVRLLAVSPPAPMPFLTAAPDAPDEVCARLRDALLSFDDEPLLCALALRGFAPVHADDYRILDLWDEQAGAARLDWISVDEN